MVYDDTTELRGEVVRSRERQMALLKFWIRMDCTNSAAGGTSWTVKRMLSPAIRAHMHLTMQSTSQYLALRTETTCQREPHTPHAN